MAEVTVFMVRFRDYHTNERVWRPGSYNRQLAYELCRQLALDGREPTLYCDVIDPVAHQLKRRTKIRFRRKCKVYATNIPAGRLAHSFSVHQGH